MDKQELKDNIELLTQSGHPYLGRVVRYEELMVLVDNLDEPEKPEIPKFVADWIEEVKQRGCGLADALNCFVSPIMPEKVKQWIQFDFAAIGCHHDNQELLAKAWLNGYTIEKEPVWMVKTFAGYLTKFETFVNNNWRATTSNSKDDKDIITFECKEKANEIATLIDGEVEEWGE